MELFLGSGDKVFAIIGHLSDIIMSSAGTSILNSSSKDDSILPRLVVGFVVGKGFTARMNEGAEGLSSIALPLPAVRL
jgi:hypothetical protein